MEISRNISTTCITLTGFGALKLIAFLFRIVPSVVSPISPHVAYALPPGINYSLIHGIKLRAPSRDSQADTTVLQEEETKEQIPR